MKIQIGQITLDKVTGQKIIYPNKSKKYLLPLISVFGEEFINKINGVFKVAVGVGDIILRQTGRKHEKHLFILCDTVLCCKQFIEFLSWVKNRPEYEDDYVFGNIQKSTFHMIIIKLPDDLAPLLETFKHGGYSKMFGKKQIDEFFSKRKDVLRVIIQDHNYNLTFTRELNKIYGTTLKAGEYEGELDFPPKPETEIFNHHLK